MSAIYMPKLPPVMAETKDCRATTPVEMRFTDIEVSSLRRIPIMEIEEILKLHGYKKFDGFMDCVYNIESASTTYRYYPSRRDILFFDPEWPWEPEWLKIKRLVLEKE